MLFYTNSFVLLLYCIQLWPSYDFITVLINTNIIFEDVYSCIALQISNDSLTLHFTLLTWRGTIRHGAYTTFLANLISE